MNLLSLRTASGRRIENAKVACSPAPRLSIDSMDPLLAKIVAEVERVTFTIKFGNLATLTCGGVVYPAP